MDYIETLINQPWAPLLFGLLASLLAGVLITLFFMRWASRRLGRRNRARGMRAERRAVKLLRKNGFRLLSPKPVFCSELIVNDQPESYEITPDLLVEKDDQVYVVEVKRYRDNGGVSNAGTRRQVLEYLHATDYPCLLVRMPEGVIDVVELPGMMSGDNGRQGH